MPKIFFLAMTVPIALLFWAMQIEDSQMPKKIEVLSLAVINQSTSQNLTLKTTQ